MPPTDHSCQGNIKAPREKKILENRWFYQDSFKIINVKIRPILIGISEPNASVKNDRCIAFNT